MFWPRRLLYEFELRQKIQEDYEEMGYLLFHLFSEDNFSGKELPEEVLEELQSFCREIKTLKAVLKELKTFEMPS